MTTRIIVLSRDQALSAWKAELGGQERLILSSADLFFDGDRLHLRANEIFVDEIELHGHDGDFGRSLRLEFGVIGLRDVESDRFEVAAIRIDGRRLRIRCGANRRRTPALSANSCNSLDNAVLGVRAHSQ